ncbi:hypothetical protein CDAR_611021 [Caerostris darwini]|uniref:Uncharacterized protein n=1 Tax=Caerostris darwini TaxID=1538125 RepID=A0AAV4Q9A2_9ARAC|nr:hypothetical protein CDAR_611021 [Caerostris darwini]
METVYGWLRWHQVLCIAPYNNFTLKLMLSYQMAWGQAFLSGIWLVVESATTEFEEEYNLQDCEDPLEESQNLSPSPDPNHKNLASEDDSPSFPIPE